MPAKNNSLLTMQKILDFGALTIDVPQRWHKVITHGVDSFVGDIAIDSVDTVGFDLGF
jgi:hypothetical protein